jgi:hypothetical protein
LYHDYYYYYQYILNNFIFIFFLCVHIMFIKHSSCVYSQYVVHTMVGPCAKGHFIHARASSRPGVLLLLLLQSCVDQSYEIRFFLWSFIKSLHHVLCSHSYFSRWEALTTLDPNSNTCACACRTNHCISTSTASANHLRHLYSTCNHASSPCSCRYF